MNYVFQLTSMDTAALQEQLARALEKRTELISRAKYPALWRITDKLPGRGKERKSTRRSRVLGLVNLALGIFLLVPGLMQPKEMFIPLLAGMAAIGAGLGGLMRSRKHQPDRFDHAAAKLLKGRDYLATGSCTVTFDDAGIKIIQDGKMAQAAWKAFVCLVETEDLLVAAYDTRATVLKKADFKGDMNGLRKLVKKNTTYARI